MQHFHKLFTVIREFIKFADGIWLENAANLLEERVNVQSKIREMP